MRNLTVEIARLKGAPGYVEVERNRKRNAPRVRLGIQFEAIEEGLRVTRVHEGSAAAQSGLQNNDILRQLDGMDLANTDDLTAVLRRIEPGKDYPLAVGRKGKNLKLRIVPERR